jgi:hypothetical protein
MDTSPRGESSTVAPHERHGAPSLAAGPDPRYALTKRGHEYLRGCADGLNDAPAPLTATIGYWTGYRDGQSAREDAARQLEGRCLECGGATAWERGQLCRPCASARYA